MPDVESVATVETQEASNTENSQQEEWETADDGQMSLIDHLQELRQRIIKSLLAIGVGFVVSYFFADQLIGYVTAPAGKLYYMNPAEGFFSYVKISLVTGFLAALPVVLHQLWAFLVPALTSREKTAMVLLVPASVILFYTGLIFSYYLVLPAALKFFIGFTTENLQPLLSLGQYLSFVISFLLPFGIVFELPLFLVVLAKVGIISSAFLMRKRKIMIVAAFIIGGVVSPTPDVFSQTMIAIPLLLLYEASILVLKHFMKK